MRLKTHMPLKSITRFLSTISTNYRKHSVLFIVPIYTNFHTSRDHHWEWVPTQDSALPLPLIMADDKRRKALIREITLFSSDTGKKWSSGFNIPYSKGL